MEDLGNATTQDNIQDKNSGKVSIMMRRKRSRESRPPSEHRESKSIRLILAQEIQDGLEEVDEEEERVTERGKQVEEKLKGLAPGEIL